MSPLDLFAKQQLETIKQQHLYRSLAETGREEGIHVTRNGTRYISFSCNDYLGLSHHPKVIEAAIQALQTYGAGAGASRLVTGNHPLYKELETKLAAFKGTESACVFGSGYLANIGIIPALVGKNDLILADKLVHACLLDGAKLSEAKLLRFAHNDVEHCRTLLEKYRSEYRHALILTDHVFSMDGDVAPVAELFALAQEHGAWLMTDDAHGLGIVRDQGAISPPSQAAPEVTPRRVRGSGRGLSRCEGGMLLSSHTTTNEQEKLLITPHGSTYAPLALTRSPSRGEQYSDYLPDLQMGTLSKAVGSYGGYVCASNVVIDYLKNTARSFIFSTGLPPATIAASIAALDIMATDTELTTKPLAKAQLFTSLLGIKEAESPIVALILGEPEKALAASVELEKHGFLVSAIRPPTVPPGTARLRFTFSALHENKDIEQLAGAVGSFM